MTSWRDEASPEAQDELDGLLGEALPLAQQLLHEHGEFFPYGVALEQSGEVVMVGGDPGQGEHPASPDVLRTMVEGLRGARDTLRAVALVSDVRLADSDAVRVELEHREGLALAVLLPYRPRRFRSGVDYGEMSAVGREAQIWSG